MQLHFIPCTIVLWNKYWCIVVFQHIPLVGGTTALDYGLTFLKTLAHSSSTDRSIIQIHLIKNNGGFTGFQ